MNFRETIRQNPFLRFLLPLIMGIVMVNQFAIPQSIGLVSVCVGIAGVVLFTLTGQLRKSYSLRPVFGVFVFLMCVGFGSIRYNDVNANRFLPIKESNAVFIGEILETPVEKANSYSSVLEVRNLNNSGNWQKVSGKTILYLQKDKNAGKLKTGDIILLKAQLQKVKNQGNPYEFDYAGYLKNRHILYSVYADSLSWKHMGKDQNFSILSIASNWRDHLLAIYQKNGITDESFDILAALTLGYKTGIDPEVKKAWADAGAMHVLAVSGLHVGIIYLIMSFLLRFLLRIKYGYWLRGIILLITLWMYALLTGMSPSVMRSATMFSFIVTGEMLKRNGSVYNSLAISAFFLLLIDPLLLFTVGFQFSYLAVLSIVFFQPRFDKLIRVENPVLKKFWQLTTVALAAQIGTFPLAIYYFHQFPSYFLLSGYLVISMAGILIYLSALLLLFSPVSVIPESLGWLLQNLVKLMNTAIVTIQNLPGAVVTDLSIGKYQVGLTYLLLISLIFLIILKQKKAVFAFLTILIAFQVPGLSRIIQIPAKEMIVFNSKKHSLIGFIEGGKAVFLTDEGLPSGNKDRIIRPYLLRKNIKNVVQDTLKPLEIRAFGKHVVAIIGSRNCRTKEVLDLIQPDYVIFRSKGLKPENILTKETSNSQLILDASIYQSDCEKFILEQKNNGLNIFDVRQNGAFVCYLSPAN